MAPQWRDQLTRFGIWRGVSLVTPELAAQIEQLGFGALWLGGSPAELGVVDDLLSATTRLVVATGIVNIWRTDPHQIAASYASIESRHPGRFVLGVGTGHPESVEQYTKPYETITRYVETLLVDGVPRTSLILAALGPRVLRLAAERTAGAHPYLVPPAYTAWAREIVGPGPLLAVEHKAVIAADPQEGREIGRSAVRPYLRLVNYTNNLRRLGWTDADLANGGSDALVDALVAHGNPASVAEQVTQHLSAGADHVCVQTLPAQADPLDGYRPLAAALGL